MQYGDKLSGYAITVTQDDINNPESPCSKQFEWKSEPTKIIETPISVTQSNTGDPVAYPMKMNEIKHKIYDCERNQLPNLFAIDNSLEENNTSKVNNSTELSSNSATSTWFFPNPVAASSQLQLKLADEEETIKIYDNLGHMLVTKYLSGSVTLNISELPKGVYFIEKTNKYGDVSGEKLIIY